MPALVPLIALALVMFDAAADVLPDTPLFGVLTPVRIVLLVGLLALTPAAWRTVRADLRVRWPFDLCVALLVAAAAVPAHVFDGWSQWRGLVTCVGVAVLALGVIRTTPGTWRAVTAVAAFCVATGALAGIRQTVNRIPTGFCRGALDGSSDSCGHPDVIVRALGTFGNPNLLAAFLVLLIPLAVAHAVDAADRNTRAVAMLVPVAGVLGVAATGSRAGLLALAASGVAYVVLRRPTTRRLVVGGAVVAATLLAGAAALVLGAGIGVRADVWQAAARLVRAHPLGLGLGRTGDVLAATVPGDEQFRHAHNLWLDMLLATGPLGLLAVIGLTVIAAVLVVRGAQRGSTAAVALGSALAGFAVFCLVDNPINAIRNAYAAWLVLGLAVGAGLDGRPRSEGDGVAVPPVDATAHDDGSGPRPACPRGSHAVTAAGV